MPRWRTVLGVHLGHENGGRHLLGLTQEEFWFLCEFCCDISETFFEEDNRKSKVLSAHGALQ